MYNAPEQLYFLLFRFSSFPSPSPIAHCFVRLTQFICLVPFVYCISLCPCPGIFTIVVHNSKHDCGQNKSLFGS